MVNVFEIHLNEQDIAALEQLKQKQIEHFASKGDTAGVNIYKNTSLELLAEMALRTALKQSLGGVRENGREQIQEAEKV